MSNKIKPRRNFKKNVATTSKRIDMDLDLAVTQAWAVQSEIDRYNKSLIEEEIDSFFKDVKLANDYILFRPFKENFIKEYIEETKTASSIGFRRIDNRKRTTDQEDYVYTPFKYINAGVIISASNKFLEDYDINIGDILYTKQIRWKDFRFYIDRQDALRDYIHSQDNWTLAFFEGYFLITPYDIELSISKETFKNKFMNKIISPIYGKTTLEDLIKHHKDLEDKLKKERDYTNSPSTTSIGEEVNIDSVTNKK